jgi:hypothetical protein
MTKTYDEKLILEKQIRDWTAELKRLAHQIAAAKGLPCAIVMISPLDEDYQESRIRLTTISAGFRSRSRRRAARRTS